ncbi:hypothetical protein DYB32_000305 [Aphanomyces invadans]|uniref:C2 domain-containing protein n=1 Tax=Aphanomyces invadans TaxID=157072 RepID=A0A3R6Z675_9STRA|nr:hypothetical protein DYB32_000305 [Aphanomyces invadans]
MIQQALALMLQRLLGKFLTLDSSQLNLSIWDGDLTFKNIQLKLGYGRGDVGELQIQVPWRSLWSQPVVIKAQHIRIYAHANSEPPDGTTQQTAAPAATDEQDKTYLSKLLACIVGNVQIELDDIVIQYECNDEVRDKVSIPSRNETTSSAILGEVKAPFDQYGQFSKLTPSKVQGFALVLTYAKQWLLSDCIDDSSNGKTSYSDDDEDDVFEDAIAPPSLSVRMALETPLEISVIPRDAVANLHWSSFVDGVQFQWRQTCVETEIQVGICSILVQEIDDERQDFIVQHRVVDSTPCIQFSCTLPELESLRVGAPTRVTCWMDNALTIKLSDKCVTEWGVLASPLWEWYETWDQQQPTVAQNQSTTNETESLVVFDIRLNSLKATVNVTPSFFLGAQVDSLSFQTNSSDTDMTTTMAVTTFDVFSSQSTMLSLEYISATLIRRSHLKTDGACRCNHMFSNVQSVPTIRSSNSNGFGLRFSKNMDEYSLYSFIAKLPSIHLSVNETDRSLDLIQNSVAKIPEYTAGSLFGAEDAAFHDAADEDVIFSATPWLSFELIGLSGWTVDPVSGAYSVQNIGIRFNEWSLELLEYQYGTIIGMIYENFKEANNIVSENLWSRCASCGGFHDDSAVCNVDWLRVTIDVLDASLTLHKTYSTPETSTKMDLEQLSIQVAMKTSDELDIDVSVMSLNVSDVHELIQDYIKPTQSIRDVPQVRLASTSTYTDSKYTVQVGHSHIVILPKSLQILSSFFTWPFWMAEDKDETVFVAGPVVEWEIMEVAVIFDKACCFYFLENFAKVDTRALVLMSEIKLDYTWSQSAPDKTSSTKFDLAMQPRGLYFSTLPDLAVDVDFPLMNSFTFQYMHLMEYVHEPSLQATQRYALSLYAEQSNIHAIPVEARLSVQDFLLLANIGHNYANTKANSLCGPELTTVVETPRVLSDKFLADIGGLRVVMVNNSLGVPILDVVMSEIGCEYENTGDAVMIVGGIFRCNYFNNSIYRWEPLIEPFKIQSDIVLSKSLTMQLNFPFAFNFNLTPAMTPILFMDNLLLTDDIVASGAKVTTPFWLKNSLGTSVKFSFAHGQTFIQDTVEHSQVVPIDCRDKVTHLRSFDKASELDALLYQKNSLTAQHSLYATSTKNVSQFDCMRRFIWVTGSMWMSAHPVTVDVVGHISICLKLKDDATAPPDENVPYPVIAAEISLQEDGSKLIHIHSQVLIANETSLPLIVWGYAPPGMIEEWIVDRESTSYVPLHLIHPEARLSVRPSLDTDYAPLASTFGEFDMDIKSSQLSFDTQRKRFIRTGTCICKHKPNDSTSAVMAMQLLPGMVVRELPPWHCVFDVEAFALINTAVDSSATTLRRGSTTVAADSEEDDIDVFEALLKLEDEESSTLAKSQTVVDVLEEAKQAKHVQGMKLEHFAHVLTLKPCLTLHNRLACPVAYRILEQSLQLVAEGILGVGAILPLFQINLHEEIFVSYRLENYNWSEPVTMVHPKHCPLPYKESILSIRITGRTFPDAANYKNAQGQVPELQLKLKRRDRDVIVYSPLWIVNHAGMPLEYCDALSRKSLETALTFVHNRPASLASTCFVRRQTTLTSPMAVPEDFHLFEKSASIVPVAIYVVVKEARNLINSHKFVGTQNPYIRASLFIPKQSKNEDLVDSLFCFEMTRAHIGGGQNPKFKMNNTMYLPFPEELGTYQLQFARIVVEVRSVWYGSESLLGIVTLPLSEVMSNRDVYAGFQWHELVKKKSSSKKGPAEAVSAGQVEMSITLATKHFIENHAESDNMWGTVLTTPRQQMRKSLQSHGDTAYNLTVYLPTNRFTSVEVSVLPSTTVMEIVKKVANLGGFIMAPDDYILVELLLPRFVSLRSAGRPEAERWFGSVLTDKLSPIQSNVHSIYILQAQLDMVGGSIVCVFRDESKRWPPYRIDNFTSFRLQFHQTHWNKDVWDEVQPRSSVPYSWDNHEGRQAISADGNQTLVLERYLDVRFMQVSSSLALDVSNAVVDTKEYNLDMMQKHKRIQLTRSLPASLFDGCPVQGALLKKDNAINWSKRYCAHQSHNRTGL